MYVCTYLLLSSSERTQAKLFERQFNEYDPPLTSFAEIYSILTYYAFLRSDKRIHARTFGAARAAWAARGARGALETAAAAAPRTVPLDASYSRQFLF